MITDRGVILKSSDAGFSWVRPAQRQPTSIEVASYPEPASGLTTIRYTLPKAQHVTLSVYDLAGRVIQSPVQNVLEDAGAEKISIDGSKLSAGVYSYRLTSEEYEASGKITIVR